MDNPSLLVFQNGMLKPVEGSWSKSLWVIVSMTATVAIAIDTMI